MNFLDQFQQDQEAAKSDLNSMLNQKAFDLLDTYADNSEVEVVTFDDEDETNESVEDLDEGLGNLAGLSKHLIKTVTKDPYSGRLAGEHSDVETHPIKNKSGHRAVLNKALDDGHVPVVYVNGKIHSAGHSTGSSYGRAEYHIHDADKQKEQKETIYPKPRRYGGKVHYSPPHETSNPRYKKGDALEHLTPGHEASFYKENKVEVKVIKPDPERLKKMKARADNRPAMQHNSVKMTPAEKAKHGYYSGDTKTVSKTPEGDNLKAVKDAAALKLATKKLGGDSPSANKKAMELHAELGKHLAAGKHRDAINTANALADHVRNQGLTTHADKIRDYADTLKGLKDKWSNKEYAHKKLAKMRGETNESEELVEALELLLTEMLDTNEAVELDEGFAPGKTVWTSHTDKPLKGKIVSKDTDNKDQYIVKHSDGNHSVHKDHIHAKEEYAKYMQEAVVPGSVKKDKHGNVLSFKTVGDKAKKLVQDRKTGKWYDPMEEFDKLIKKEEIEDNAGEQIDELSKKTLGSYVKKASTDAKFKAFTGGYIEGSETARAKKYGDGVGAGAEDDDKAHKRLKGISKAVDKLTK
jgi:hypothetical protein